VLDVFVHLAEHVVEDGILVENCVDFCLFFAGLVPGQIRVDTVDVDIGDRKFISRRAGPSFFGHTGGYQLKEVIQ
jgi:hypothetical protein